MVSWNSWSFDHGLVHGQDSVRYDWLWAGPRQGVPGRVCGYGGDGMASVTAWLWHLAWSGMAWQISPIMWLVVMETTWHTGIWCCRGNDHCLVMARVQDCMVGGQIISECISITSALRIAAACATMAVPATSDCAASFYWWY